MYSVISQKFSWISTYLSELSFDTLNQRTIKVFFSNFDMQCFHKFFYLSVTATIKKLIWQLLLSYLSFVLIHWIKEKTIGALLVCLQQVLSFFYFWHAAFSRVFCKKWFVYIVRFDKISAALSVINVIIGNFLKIAKYFHQICHFDLLKPISVAKTFADCLDFLLTSKCSFINKWDFYYIFLIDGL